MTLAASRYGEVFLNGNTAPQPCVYHLQNEWMNPLASKIDQVFSGGCEPWLDSLWNDGRATFESITQQVNNVASAVTNHMRLVGLAWDAIDDASQPAREQDRAFVTGMTEETFLCVQFNWMWLLLPTALTVVTLVLLLTSVIRTHEYAETIPAWKSSVLPVLFHGFRGNIEGVPPDHRMSHGEIQETLMMMIASLMSDRKGGCGFAAESGADEVEIDPDDHALATSPALYAIMAKIPDYEDDGAINYMEEAVRTHAVLTPARASRLADCCHNLEYADLDAGSHG
ncbi:hypothetical protein B0T14DRAFT_565464 [Immersiella caudata]|uniref:Uncharacterized protein n=1 Tax=Immersiella caudata TaxID=314043 RepID=A0AA40C3M7_9PEZI|nr:hypothetical protein B0T14DRAFT_565464 [Immersiella caudata]